MSLNQSELVRLIVEDLSDELDEDNVGFWVLPWLIRQHVPNGDPRTVRGIARLVLDVLLDDETFLGDLDERSGQFSAWREGEPAMTAMTRWEDLGRDPTIGEIAWLARPSAAPSG